MRKMKLRRITYSLRGIQDSLLVSNVSAASTTLCHVRGGPDGNTKQIMESQ